MQYLEEINLNRPHFGEFYDELPLWSARFGLLLLDQVELRPGLSILDVGAGTGFLSVELAQRCGADAVVIAVDPWETALQRLVRKLDYLGIKNVRPLIQDAANIDLPDASVDLIVSNLGINNFENADAVLRNCWRVAKPGARLVLTTNLVGHMSEFYDIYRRVLGELGYTEQVATLDAHVNRRATVSSVQAMLANTGFEPVKAVTQTFRERFADGSALLRHYFIRLGFVPGWKAIAPERAVAKVFAALERRLNDESAERGELALSVPAACIQAIKPAP